MNKLLLWAVGIIFLLAVTGSMAMAATATSGLNVSASVANGCNMISVANITFSNPYETMNPTANDSGAGSFTFRCTKNTSYKLFMAGIRTMTDSIDTLTYELYKEFVRTTVWESDNTGSSTISGSNAPVSPGVFGRIPALQDVGAGAYAGSVTVTVEW